MGAYDLDLHAWAAEQAEALRRRSANELDWDNIAEEIDSLGRQQRAELYNRLVVILLHLLKWTYQPDLRGRSWSVTLDVQREELSKHLRQNPSLKSAQDEEFSDAYRIARKKASGETDLPLESFPAEPPFTLAQALDAEWLPGGDDQSSSTVSNGS